MVGQPDLVGVGDAETEHHAGAKVHEVMDRELEVQETLRSLDPTQQTFADIEARQADTASHLDE